MAATAPGPRLYRPRRPERTLPYRALAGQFERFLAPYEVRFGRPHGFLRRSVEKAVYRYLDCELLWARGPPNGFALRPSPWAKRLRDPRFGKMQTVSFDRPA